MIPMKRILIAMTFIIPIGALASAGPGGVPFFGQPAGPDGLLNGLLGNPVIQAGESGTHVRLYVPGFLIKMAAGMAGEEMPDEARQALKFIKGISIEVADGAVFYEGYEHEADRLQEKYERKKKYHTLVSVKTADADVHVTAKHKKNGTIRRLVVLVCAEETFVHIKLQTRVRQKDLQKLLKNLDFENIISEVTR